MAASVRIPLRDALPPNRRRQIALAFPIAWNVSRPFRQPSATAPGPYYIAWDAGTGTYGEDWTIAPRDADKIILTSGRQPSYHPIRIAQYALHKHDLSVMAGDEAARVEFLAHARWLRDNQRERNGVPGCYIFNFAWEKYGAAPGWISAMAQGEAISVLLRAHAMEPGAGFAEAALNAAQPFRRTIAEGGVVWRGQDGDVFFEEAAVEPAAHILNGSLYATFGLFDLLRFQHDDALKELFDEAVVTLLRRLMLFDSGFWSYYSLLQTPGGYRAVATLKYHAFHIAQLKVLAAMTGDGYFHRVAVDWDRYRMQLDARGKMIFNELTGLPVRFITHRDTVNGGARAVL